MSTDSVAQQPRQIRVTVVGPCASGKTTLVEQLRNAGYEAWVTGQEHSAVPDLWNHQEPDVLIALATDLETIRLRRGKGWSGVIYAAQIERLQRAYEAAGLIIDTGASSEDETTARALAYLAEIASQRAK